MCHVPYVTGKQTQEHILRSVALAVVCGAVQQMSAWHFAQGPEAMGATEAQAAYRKRLVWLG